METITFVNELKHNLWIIEKTGGNPTLHVTTDHSLLRRLREMIFQKAHTQGQCVSADGNRRQYFFEDLISTDRFERRIRYCVIKLREFGITSAEYFTYISDALEVTLNSTPREERIRRTSTTLRQMLVDELARCFEMWYYPAEAQYYDFAAQHQLAAFDYALDRWRLSSLGKFLLNQPPYQVVVFLCALEVVLSRRESSSYINSQLLETLVRPGSARNHPRSRGRLPTSLYRLGIVDPSSEKPRVTDLGKRIVSRVTSNLESLRDTILLLTESEMSGIGFSQSEDLVDQIVQQTRYSANLLQDQKTSIESAVSLFLTGHYLDSLRLFYPNIEGALNQALRRMGLRPEDCRGMKEKVQRLEREQVISSRLGTWGEVISSRNKIVHGNLVEEDEELIRPLFYFIGTFWVALIQELDK